tara:strand:+ start:443 stop:1399 length:957 start_codon:yes stop_codon:yes gene_type:complete
VSRVVFFISYRVLALVITVLVASLAIFGLLALVPGDPAAALAGTSEPNPETIAEIRKQFRLDDPFLTRYFGWLGDLVAGDLGRSFVYRAEVTSLLSDRIGNSLFLVVYSAIIILVAGVGLGVLAALGGRRTDRIITIFSSIAMGAPTFVVAILLITTFSVYLDWFPVFGSGDDFLSQLHHLTLPAIAMSLAYLAFVSRMTRTSVRAEMLSEHVETARTRGVPARHIVWRHVLRNALPQILSVSGITVAGLLASTAVAEEAFGVSGVGSLLVEAAARGDIPVVQIIALMMVVAFVSVNTVVDIINGALDPRIAAKGLGR